jgi:hypothetical protein
MAAAKSDISDREKILEDEVASLKNYVAELEKRLAAAPKKDKDAEKPGDSIELAVIFSGDKIPVETLLGKKYKETEDENKFTHVFVPEPAARRLLASDGPTKFLLAGGADSFALTRQRGLHSEALTVYRHECKDGKWTPVKPEEKKAKGGDA